MDRKKILLLAALGACGFGAAWWARNRAAGDGLVGADNLSGTFGTFGGLVAGLEDAAQVVAETVQGAVGAWSPPAKAAPYLAAIAAAEDAAGAPRNLFCRQIRQESNFNPNAVNARSGAKGLGQFMDATWAEWGQGADVFEPFANIDALGRYMAWLYARLGTWQAALAAYNWGIGNVQRKGLSAAPEETRRYMADIAGDIGYA